jgi:hypothetical protein
VDFADDPIFILASGQRCGSTLLQRLLNSNPRILIWGEHEGALNGFRGEVERIVLWERKMGGALDRYLDEGYDNWTATMTPSAGDIDRAARAFIGTLFAEPAARLGRTRWGFKEVRYDLDTAAFLQQLFPETRVVYLTRDVVDCFISLKHWENDPLMAWSRENTLSFLRDWERVNASFVGLRYTPRWCMPLRYEELAAGPERVTTDLCSFLAIDPSTLDMRVFARRIHRGGRGGEEERIPIPRSSLDAEERALLTQPDILAVSAALGYTVHFEDR